MGWIKAAQRHKRAHGAPSPSKRFTPHWVRWNLASSQLAICPQVVLTPQVQPDGVAATGAGVAGAGTAGAGAAATGAAWSNKRGVVLHEAVALALDGLDPPIALHFPGIRWVLPAPGRIKLPILPGEVEAVSVGHVEHRPGDVTLDGLRRFGPAGAAVHFDIAGPERPFLAGDHAPVVVLALAVDFAHGGHQVEQVVVGGLEQRVHRLAAGPARERPAVALGAGGKSAGVAPARAEVAELGGREEVLRFDALRPGLVSQRLQPATGEIDPPIRVVGAAAVKRDPVIGVDLIYRAPSWRR